MTSSLNSPGADPTHASGSPAQGDDEPRPQQGVAGTIAIIGRPNVGKSVLLNEIVGQKLAIVSPRPQTTRNRILGVWNGEDSQIVFVDTPGIHKAGAPLNRFMNQEALDVVEGVEAILVVIDAAATISGAGKRPLSASGATSVDERIVDQALATGKPVVLALNKVDQVKNKPALLPLLQHWDKVVGLHAQVPISGLRGTGVHALVTELEKLMPPGPPLYDADMLTDRSSRFLVSELIREQLFLRLHDELPYATAVYIDKWQDRPRGDVVIDATILVEKHSQKVIAVGKQGRMIREVGTAARKEASALLGQPVHLRLFVKVAPEWSQSPSTLDELGYQSEKAGKSPGSAGPRRGQRS